MQLPTEIGALFLAGAAGAFVRAVYRPEPSWTRRLLEGLAGALSAIFLGGLVGHVIDATIGGGTWAYLAAGFLMGEAGIAGVQALRKRFIEKEEKK
ncbi:hypothetical protein LX81_00291 [Palleronia aestuarii]|uniref:LydA family holin superfamily III n=1 Tax=Palleronia aestuarii TaxID=568105 RepID=A0A2W7NHU2_9RHOB|nr:hypothetical protein [Palleronia aestuarii]PZX19828.1 hypothetical protein LX81_00291 [Palleronia aestuarii]